MPPALAVFAHPDDEVVALGARLGRLREAHLVHTTDGAPRNGNDSRDHGFSSVEDYRRARQEELESALRLAGLTPISRECFGIPDQEASFCLFDLTQRIVQLLDCYQPQVLFTHPYEGGHPDHDACAYAVHRAVESRTRECKAAPQILECAFYHAGPQGIETGSFLPWQQQPQQVIYRLSPEEKRRKQALLACFVTQQETLRYFTLERECFRIAPAYDFGKPPHPGQLFYDRYPWGIASGKFRELVSEADAALDTVLEERQTACP